MIGSIKKIEWQIDIARELFEKHSVRILFDELFSGMSFNNIPYDFYDTFTNQYITKLQIISVDRDLASGSIKSVLFSENVGIDCGRMLYPCDTKYKRFYVTYKKPLAAKYKQCECRQCCKDIIEFTYYNRCLKRWI